MIPSNLIVNCDDFGLNPAASLAIRQCVEEGLINSFSSLPFTDSFHADLLRDLRARFPDVKIGAHLTLLAPASGLEEHSGHFRDVLTRYALGKIKPAQIRAQWEAHIRALGEYLGGAGNVAHLDGHQHVHVLPGLWQAALSLQKQFAIPRLRVPYESLARGVTYRFPFGLGLQALARLRKTQASPRLIGFFTSTRFTVRENLPALRKALRHPELPFELMVHGEVDELRRLRDFFQAEVQPTGAAPAPR
jgi:predicted glycoside hydrolase/deacetylase ChbG (UPF0249 family)